MILVLADSGDIHAKLVCEAITRIGSEYIRLDTDLYPRICSFEARLENGTLKGWLTDGKTRTSFDEIGVIWWHHISEPRVVELVEPKYKSWMRSELTSAISTIASAIRAPIFPHPDHVQAAGRKLRQLLIASELGFNVPDTLITSIPDSLKNFCSAGDTIFKSLSHPQITDETDKSKARIVYANLVKPEHDEFVDDLKHSVGFFQRFIKKIRDIRLTIVDKEVFCVAIESQKSQATSIDWRRYNLPQTPHYSIEAPKDVIERCLKLLDKFNLSFGAFDFAEDEENNWWFLELNANGLWAWVELLTGAKISFSIASHLVRLSNLKESTI